MEVVYCKRKSIIDEKFLILRIEVAAIAIDIFVTWIHYFEKNLKNDFHIELTKGFC